MRQQIEARLGELKQQFAAGQSELQQVQTRENGLRETMLRISGAIQVLEELLTEQPRTETGTASVTADQLEHKARKHVGGTGR